MNSYFLTATLEDDVKKMRKAEKSGGWEKKNEKAEEGTADYALVEQATEKNYHAHEKIVFYHTYTNRSAESGSFRSFSPSGGMYNSRSTDSNSITKDRNTVPSPEKKHWNQTQLLAAINLRIVRAERITNML